MSSHYINLISSHLGNDPKDFQLNGEFFRFGPNNRCWAIGHEWVHAKKNYYSIWCGDWSNGGLTKEFHSHQMFETTQAENKAKKQREQLKQRIRLEKELKLAEVSKKAADLYEKSSPGNHPYLKKKQIEIFSAKIFEGKIIVPMTDGDRFTGIQYINEKGSKKFEPGSKLGGSYFLLDESKDLFSAETIYLAEGFATAASIQTATDYPVVCCFTANNVARVAENLSTRVDAFFILCGDRDKKNPKTGERAGEKTARELSRAVQKSKTVWPWDNVNKIGDFNDLHLESGLEAVKKRIDLDFVSKQEEYFKNLLLTGFSSVSERGHIRRLPDKLCEYLVYKHNYAYFPKIKSFYFFTGKRFKLQEDDRVKGFAQTYYDPVLVEDKPANEFLNYCRRNVPQQRDTDLLSSHNDRYICFENGLYDIEEEKLIPHSKDIFVTVKIPHEYDPEATCPVYDEMMANLLDDDDVIDLANEFLGFSLWNCKYDKFQKFMIFSGEGENGKSTVIDIWGSVIGEKNRSAIMLSDLGNPNNKFLAARLEGSLLNVSEEERRSVFKDTGILKKITGGTDIEFERKGKDSYQGAVRCKLLMSQNHIPEIDDLSRGMLRRPIVVNFKHNLKDAPERVIKDVKTKVASEYSGIINRAIQGIQRLRIYGEFTESRESSQALKSMIKSSNPVYEFVQERVKPSKEGSIWIGDAWEVFRHDYEDDAEDYDKNRFARNFNKSVREKISSSQIKRMRRNGRQSKLESRVNFAILT